MRASGCALLIAVLAGGPACADGRCDLNTPVGCQPIAGYIQAGVRKAAYEVREPDRVLLFAGTIGMLVRQHLDALPTGYLVARGNLGDLKPCVEGDLIAVSQTN